MNIDSKTLNFKSYGPTVHCASPQPESDVVMNILEKIKRYISVFSENDFSIKNKIHFYSPLNAFLVKISYIGKYHEKYFFKNTAHYHLPANQP